MSKDLALVPLEPTMPGHLPSYCLALALLLLLLLKWTLVRAFRFR